MTSRTLNIQSKDGLNFDAYLAEPAEPNGAVVVVIQEIFGVNQWVRNVADWLAGQGYFALAPDLFHRQEKNIQLTDQTDAEWKKAFALYEGFDQEKGVDDLLCTVSHARKIPGSNGKVGTIGFCLGGKMAYLMSTRSDSEANVSYYAVGVEDLLKESVSRPLVMHMAALDQYVPAAAQDKIKGHLGSNPKVTLYTYQEDHAFARQGGAHYSKQAADLAHQRTLEFFQSQLTK